jgi:hypothetical protein
MSFFCCTSNILKSVIDISNIVTTVDVSVDVSANIIDISNIKLFNIEDTQGNFSNPFISSPEVGIFNEKCCTINLDISNNERIVPILSTEYKNTPKIIDETSQLLQDVKETLIDISNNPHHIINIKEDFLARTRIR